MDPSAVPATYRSIPTEVTAARWLPDDPQAAGRVVGWICATGATAPIGDDGRSLLVLTIAGQTVPVLPGEWVIAEPTPGRFYPCADDVFRKRYRHMGGLMDSPLQRWSAFHVAPEQAKPDSDEHLPHPGWWVAGVLPDEEPDDGPFARLHIEFARNTVGDSLDEWLARRIAALLTEGS